MGEQGDRLFAQVLSIIEKEKETKNKHNIVEVDTEDDITFDRDNNDELTCDTTGANTCENIVDKQRASVRRDEQVEPQKQKSIQTR